MKNAKIENASIFTVCHHLTRALVSGTNYDYKSTFTACIRLYYSDFTIFCASCAAYRIDVMPMAKIERKNLDFYGNVSGMDLDQEASKIVKNCINFAVYYGLRKREANISRFEMIKYKKYNTYLPGDTAAPVVVSSMKKNEIDDLKQDVFIYLYKRINDQAFTSLPAIVQLMRAGDAVVTSHYNKIIREAKSTTTSFDEMKEAGHDIGKTDNYQDMEMEDAIETIIAKIPMKHRDAAREILNIYHIRKAGKQADVAKMLNISARKVFTIVKEIEKAAEYLRQG